MLGDRWDYRVGMPIPLGGLVSIAEYGSKFEADVAANLLVDHGIRATTSYDPALNSVATYFASDRTVDVIVLPADAERARAILDEAPTDLPAAFSTPELDEWRDVAVAHRARSKALVRAVAVVLMVAVIGGSLVGGRLSALKS